MWLIYVLVECSDCLLIYDCVHSLSNGMCLLNALIVYNIFAFVNRDRYRGPSIAIIECPNKEQILKNIPTVTELPCVYVASNARDSQFPVSKG